MPTDIEWPAIALRLALTAIPSTVIGINRGELDRPVGLRRTMLVALAAAISVIQEIFFCRALKNRATRFYIDQEHRGELVFAFEPPLPSSSGLHRDSAALDNKGQTCTLQYEFRWHAAQSVQKALDLVHELGGSPGVIKIQSRAIGRPQHKRPTSRGCSGFRRCRVFLAGDLVLPDWRGLPDPLNLRPNLIPRARQQRRQPDATEA
jgi:hypothetical protein